MEHTKAKQSRFSSRDFIIKHPDYDYERGVKAVGSVSWCQYRLDKFEKVTDEQTAEANEAAEFLMSGYETAITGEDVAEWADYVHCCNCLWDNWRQKRHRLKPRLDAVVIRSTDETGKVRGLFLTMTFTDEILTTTTAEERRSQIIVFLEGLGCDYVGNLDYGKRNGREHYHAVVSCSRVDFKTYRSLFRGSNINAKHLRGSVSDDSSPLGCYLVKLTDHAVKETTTNKKRLIYSKSLRKIQPNSKKQPVIEINAV